MKKGIILVVLLFCAGLLRAEIGIKAGMSGFTDYTMRQRYPDWGKSIGIFYRTEGKPLVLQFDWEYLKTETKGKFSGFLGETVWTEGGNLKYFATPISASILIWDKFLYVGGGAVFYPMREIFEGGIAEDSGFAYYLANSNYTKSYYGGQIMLGLESKGYAIEIRYRFIPSEGDEHFRETISIGGLILSFQKSW